MIKTIFFDFDGVLTTDGAGSFTTCTSIQKHIPDIPFEHILKCYKVNHSKMLIGKTTHKSIWKEFCECVGRDLEFPILEEAFRNIPVNRKMLDLCRHLKGRYTLGVITDNSKERLDAMKSVMKLAELFSIIIVSGEIGIRKDNEETFVRALSLAKCKPEECVFIDNNENNLIAPKKLGWKTIFHDDKKNDIEYIESQLKSLGVVIMSDKG